MFKSITVAAITTVCASLLLGACSAQVESGMDKAKDAASSKVSTKAGQVASKVKDNLATSQIAALPSGIYESESGHAYIAFSYDHQGYSKPILRWSKFDATVALDAENPEKSRVGVRIDAASIDSGVEAFDGHLVGEDWFDVKNFPAITFQSTGAVKTGLNSGTLTGTLFLKGIEKPVTLDVTLNKAGQNFRSKKPMFGISATGTIKRSDFGINKYAPMAEDINLTIEIEFIKTDKTLKKAE